MHKINIHHLENVSILGLGKSTIAALDFFAKSCSHLKNIRISDIKKREDFDAELIKDLEDKFQDYSLEFEFAGQSFDFVTSKQDTKDKNNSLIMVSPGIPPRVEIMQELAKSDYLLATDFDLFTESICLDDKYDHKIFSNEDDHIANYIAITGTNGKTTTSSLIAHILETEALGNIGNPVLNYSELSKGSKHNPKNPYVVELSSFQLHYSDHFKAPHAAVYLNFTPDHLDWHADLDEYRAAKEKLFTRNNEQISVLNYDDEYLRQFGFNLPKARFFSTSHNLKEEFDELLASDHKCKFMACAYIKNNSLMLCEVHKHIEPGTKDKVPLLEMPVIRTDELQIVGEHNHANALAAILAANAVGVPISTIRDQLVSFKPVEHRLEFVTTIDGKDFYNDSKATNPESAIKAIEAFDKSIVIVGGKEKNLDLNEFIRALKERAHHVIAIGEIKEKIQTELKALGYEDITLCSSLEEAVAESLKISEKLPVVLAPGSSSFDMFKNYEVRGEKFKEIVHASSC